MAKSELENEKSLIKKVKAFGLKDEELFKNS